MKIRQLLWLVPLFLVACGGPEEPAAMGVVEDEVVPTVAPVVVVEESAEGVDETAEADAEADDHGHEHDDDGDHGHDEEGSDGGEGIASNYLGSYTIMDSATGSQVTVTVDEAAGTRTIITNALPNHETGEYPTTGNPNAIAAQDRTWTFPTEPTFIGEPIRAGLPGVAVNGIKFAPGTGERINCESGETHSLEAIQDVTSLGLDFNNAHVQPSGEYHYHGVSELLVDIYDAEQDLVHVGFAADGYLMYYSKSNAYRASYQVGTDSRAGTDCAYVSRGQSIAFGPEKDGSLTSDWTYDASYGDLDACNGTTVDGQYIYILTHDYPYISRCLMGEFTDTGPDGEGAPSDSGEQPGQGGQGDQAGQGGQGGAPGGQGGQGGPPDFDAAAAVLGVSAEAIREAMGPPPGDLEAGAAALGVTVEELQAALGMQSP